ncbi:MAG: 2OG-Fe(II) oxygenase [Mucilaginibacter polytrichastri]|nr:2OG-Fe(II) oxygenase [Mucilaginibacter polytrichastri]
MEKDILRRTGDIDWTAQQHILSEKGYTRVPRFLSSSECAALRAMYSEDVRYRKTIQMERYRFGSGEYRYFMYPLPALIEEIREAVYPQLVPVANRWLAFTRPGQENFPDEHARFLEICRQNGQTKPTVLILRYGPGGYNTLHQDLYGDVWFPFQLVLFLDEPGRDYTGGEFVITEQVPRAQSRAIVQQPQQGDLLIFSTHERPVQGTKRPYRVKMKHGVSEVLTGSRHTLGIIFHDALS